MRTFLLVPGVCFVDVPGLNVRGFEAYAGTSSDQRVSCIPVYRNPEALAELPSAVAFWIHVHELSHIYLGHGDPPEPRPPTLFYERELAADCQAARFLVQYGWTDILPVVYQWMVDEFAAGFPGEAPSGAERVANIQQCVAQALPQ